MGVFVCRVNRELVHGGRKNDHEHRSLERVSDMFGHVAVVAKLYLLKKRTRVGWRHTWEEPVYSIFQLHYERP